MDLTLLEHPVGEAEPANLGAAERALSTVGGLALVAWSARQRPSSALAALASCAAGAFLAWRGATGRCPVYEALDVSSAEGMRPFRVSPMSREVRGAITIQRPREEVYAFFRALPHLPQFRHEVRAVSLNHDGSTHWVVEPLGGPGLEWDTEVVEDVVGERVAWRVKPPSELDHEGEVELTDAPRGRGTEMRVRLAFGPARSRAAMRILQVLASDPGRVLDEDLRCFRQALEAGEMATTAGQPQGSGSLA
jgi:uncharacterized membrane protein